jgi:hypothetical protein
MTRCKAILCILGLLACLTVGCGGNGEKGKNSGQDVPRPAGP